MRADYFLFVFMVSLGVLQLAAAWARLEGISFFRRRYLGYIFAAVMVGISYGWFFRVDRNLHDIDGGLAGPLQLGFIVAALALAIFLTLIISSAVNARRVRSNPEGEEEGIEALKRMTYLQAIKRGLRRNK